MTNVPLPEPGLAGLGAGFALHRLYPWRLPGPRSVHRLLGWPLMVAGGYVVARSVVTAGQVDLAHPARLVTCGPYAARRHPMYVGWLLLHLGAGVAGGSVWLIAGLPVVARFLHREAVREEQVLVVQWGAEYDTYRATVARYGSLPWSATNAGLNAR
jgi:protein-S-isoprenylcysteine O-methyltransferase Ste14